MNAKLYIFFFIFFSQYAICHAQVLGSDTIQFVGKKNYKTGTEKTVWVSRIILNPDSTYKKGDYYYSGDKHKKNRSNVSPTVETGYWILKNKNIYFYSIKDFFGPEFKAKYKVQKNSIIYEWRVFRKKGIKVKDKTSETFDKIFGVKPIIKFVKVKMSN
jgi:hypothetical protein